MWRAHIDPMPSTDCRSLALAASTPCSEPNDAHQQVDVGELQPRDARHRAVAPRAHRRVLRLQRRRIAENPCQRGEVEQFVVRQRVEFVERGRHLRGGRRVGVGVIVADDQLAGGVVVADELLELQLELASVGAEFDDVGVDLEADPAHHLEPLHDRHHVPQRDEVLDLGGGQLPVDLVEPGLVALERGDGLVGARQDGRRVGHDVPLARDVHRHDAHRVADRDHRIAGLHGGALGRAVPGAGLVGGDRRVGHQLHVGAQDAGAVAGQHDGAVHLRQLAQPGRGVADVERESAVADGLDAVVVAEHDERARAAAQDAFQAVAQRRAGGQPAQRLAQRRAGRAAPRCRGAVLPPDFTAIAPPRIGRHCPRSCAAPCNAPADVVRGASPADPAGTSLTPGGTTAHLNPSLAASASLRSMPVTRRRSPASPTSPMATAVGGHGQVGVGRGDRPARPRDPTTGRSAACRRPWTGRCRTCRPTGVRASPARRVIIAAREESMPLTARRGLPGRRPTR